MAMIAISQQKWLITLSKFKFLFSETKSTPCIVTQTLKQRKGVSIALLWNPNNNNMLVIKLDRIMQNCQTSSEKTMDNA